MPAKAAEGRPEAGLTLLSSLGEAEALAARPGRHRVPISAELGDLRDGLGPAVAR